MRTLTEVEALPVGSALLGAEDVTLTRPMRPHTHQFAEISLVRAGAADQRAENGVTRLTPGTVVVLGPES